MRWDDLFADLEGRLEHELDQERLEVQAEEERLRMARLGFRERMLAMARAGDPVELLLADGGTLVLRVASAGRDWVAGEHAAPEVARTAIVPLDAIAGVTPHHDQLAQGLRPLPESTLPALSERLGLAFVLRDLCRRRAGVELRTLTGGFTGTIDRVARDHLDLAEHDAGEARRERAVRRIRIIRFAAILRVSV